MKGVDEQETRALIEVWAYARARGIELTRTWDETEPMGWHLQAGDNRPGRTFWPEKHWVTPGYTLDELREQRRTAVLLWIDAVAFSLQAEA